MSGRRSALIVANDTYDNAGLSRLRAPAADAEALAGVLGDPLIGGFDVAVVRNEAAHDIEGRIEDLFADSRTDDVLLLHFSCHGLKNDSGELFFAARNTRPNRLGSSAVSADFVQRCMKASRARSVVLLLDCCYGGAFSQGVSVRGAPDAHVLESFRGGALGGGRGRAVITASSAMEYAFEGDALADDRSRPSVFTSALVHGLATGEADRDRDGLVALGELYDYVFDKVRGENPHQTPSRDIQMQGELYVARNPAPAAAAVPAAVNAVPAARVLADPAEPVAAARPGAFELTGSVGVALQLLLAAAAVMLLALPLDYTSYTWMGDHNAGLVTYTAAVALLLLALAGWTLRALLAGTSVARWVPRLGLLVGACASSLVGLFALLSDLLDVSGFQLGGWLQVLAHVGVLSAGVVLARAALRELGVRVRRRRPEGELEWLVMGCALLALLALVGMDLAWIRASRGVPAVVPMLWLTVLAAIGPLVILAVRPAEVRLGVFAGWSGGMLALASGYAFTGIDDRLSDGSTVGVRWLALWIMSLGVMALLVRILHRRPSRAWASAGPQRP